MSSAGMRRKRIGKEHKSSSTQTSVLRSPKKGGSLEMHEFLLDWEHALLTLALELREFASETREVSFLITSKMMSAKSSLLPLDTSKEPAERNVCSKWEKGLRKLATGLRDLANGVVLHSSSKMDLDRLDLHVSAKQKTKAPHLQQSEGSKWESEFRRLAWEVKEHPLKAYLKSRGNARNVLSSVSKPPSASSSSSQYVLNPSRRQCALTDFVGKLKKVSRKVRKELSPERNECTSRGPPPLSISQGTETKTTYSRISEQVKVRGPLGKKIKTQPDLCQHRDANRSESLMTEIRQPVQLKKKSITGISSYSDVSLVCSKGEIHKGTFSTTLQDIGDNIFEKDELSSWGLSLRLMVRKMNQLAQSSRGKRWSSSSESTVPQPQSFEFWAGTKGGQNKLSTWERNLLSLSSEMMNVARDIRGKYISEPEVPPSEKVSSASPRTCIPIQGWLKLSRQNKEWQ